MLSLKLFWAILRGKVRLEADTLDEVRDGWLCHKAIAKRAVIDL